MSHLYPIHYYRRNAISIQINWYKTKYNFGGALDSYHILNFEIIEEDSQIIENSIS